MTSTKNNALAQSRLFMVSEAWAKSWLLIFAPVQSPSKVAVVAFCW